MTWKAEPIRQFLEITHIRENRGDFSISEEYASESLVDITLHFFKEDKELRVRPYTIECLNQLVNEKYPDGIVNELFVGICNGVNIAHVGLYWIDKKLNNERRVNQYFFKNDEPHSFNFGYISGDGWPFDQPPVLDKRLAPYFKALKEIRPNITDSLDKCMKHLTKIKPKYTRKSGKGPFFRVINE